MNRTLIRETLPVCISVITLLAIGARLPTSQTIQTLMFFGALLYVPLIIFALKKERPAFLSWTPAHLREGIQVFLIFSAVLLPFMLLGNHVFQTFIRGVSYQEHNFDMLSGSWIATRVLMAVPEEFFFRGYLQYRLDTAWGRPFKFLGANIGHGAWVAALIFALSHSAISAAGWHILIFFPALCFAWLFNRSGGVVAPILFHAFCNLFNDWAFGVYR